MHRIRYSVCSVQHGYVFCTTWLCVLYSMVICSVRHGYVLCTVWLCIMYSVLILSVQYGWLCILSYTF